MQDLKMTDNQNYWIGYDIDGPDTDIDIYVPKSKGRHRRTDKINGPSRV